MKINVNKWIETGAACPQQIFEGTNS